MWQVKRAITLILFLLGFFFSLSFARNISSEAGSDPALRSVDSVLARGRYLVFHNDTLLSSAMGQQNTDMIFINSNIALDCPVKGSVIVLNGELNLRARAEVAGDVVLVRSQMFKSRKATVRGKIWRTSSTKVLKLVEDNLGNGRVKRSFPLGVELKTNRMGGFALEGYDRVDGFSMSWGFNLVLTDLGDFPLFKGKVITATTRQAIGFDAVLAVPLDRRGRCRIGVGA